jgi:hypothetical protein
LREPNLGKTNPRVTLFLFAICFAPSLADSFIFLTLTRLVVVFIFVNFSFALFTPPLGDYQSSTITRKNRGSAPLRCWGVYSSSSGENEFAAPLSPSPVVFRLVRLGNTQSVAGIDHRRRISAVRRGLSPVLDDGRNW